MIAKPSNQGGFTLVEVLVSLFIFSLLSTATLSVLVSTLRSKEQIANKSASLQQMANLRILLKADLAQTLPIQKIDEFGQPSPMVFSGGALGTDKVFYLSRSGWGNPGGIERRSNLQAVEYRFENGVISRHSKARFGAISTTPTFKQDLLKGVSSVKASFFDGENWVDSWFTGDAPLGVDKLPKLAALDIVFDDNMNFRQVFNVGVGH